MDYLKIEFSNKCDLDNIIYQTGFLQYFLIPGNIVTWDYDVFEEVSIDAEQNATKVFQKLRKKYTIRFDAPEFFHDAVAMLLLHDYIKITLPNGDTDVIKELEITPPDAIDTGCSAIGEITFYSQSFDITKDGCCGNLSGVQAITPNKTAVVSAITTSDSIWTAPDSEVPPIPDGARYLVTNAVSVTDIWVRSYANPNWVKEVSVDGDVVQTAGGDTYYYFGGTYSKVPTCSVSAVGLDVTVTANSYPGTYATIEYKLAAAPSWTTYPTKYRIAVLQNVGITITLAAGSYLFRINSFTHQTDYGYSDEAAITIP